MNHTPLTWYEQENLSNKAPFMVFPQSTQNLQPLPLKAGSPHY